MDQNIKTTDVVLDKILKGLIDKNQDRKEQAGYQLEKLISRIIQSKNSDQVQKILFLFRNQYIRNNNQEKKKAGLQAYTYISQGLIDFPQEAEKCIQEIIEPILQCFSINEKQIKFNAIKALYYICKFLSDACMKVFKKIFNQVLNLIIDIDQEIKKSSQLLNSVLKTIVSEALAEGKQFDLVNFIKQLTQEMKINNNPFAKQFLIDWMNTIDEVPYIDLSPLLPIFLEQLLLTVGSKQKQLRSKAQDCLKDLLFNLKEKFYQSKLQVILSEEVLSEILTILIKVTKGKAPAFSKQIAILWFQQLFQFFKEQVQNKLGIKHKYVLKKIIVQRFDELLQPILSLLSHQEQQVKNSSEHCNKVLLQLMTNLNKQQKVNFSKVMPLLKEMLSEKREKQEEFQTSQSILIWMKFLLQHYNDKILPQINDIIQRLVEKLCDGKTKTVIGILQNVSFTEQYFDLVIQKLLTLLFKQKNMPNNTQNVLKIVVKVFDGSSMYKAIGIQILTYEDIKFIEEIVYTLSYLLATQPSLQKTRKSLRDLESNENKQLFFILFKAFSHNRFSALTLCYLAQQYKLAYQIVRSFIEENISSKLLLDLCKFVNIFQNPIFVSIRFHLLESQKYPFLMESISTIMMFLPQGRVHTILKNRIELANRNKKLVKKVQKSKKYLDQTDEFVRMYYKTKKFD